MERLDLAAWAQPWRRSTVAQQGVGLRAAQDECTPPRGDSVKNTLAAQLWASAYSLGAGFTGIGPSARRFPAAFSSRGFSAPITRSVSEVQPGGAGTVGPLPEPPPVM